MRHTDKLPEKILLVFTSLKQFAISSQISEFYELADSTGAHIIDTVTIKINRIHAKYYIGSGKVAELAQQVAKQAINLVIFNSDLTPAQERNLEKALCCRVMERSALILDIFASRARTFEGKLQVELAQLQHLSTRLVRGWSHLERQKGGIGLRGPGETQLEVDRRLIAKRIKSLLQKLEKVRRQRQVNRRARKLAKQPIISLVGYTNAGKSTLFNALTKSTALSADQLFATLDPMFRRCELMYGRATILTDTVGFIRDLPHDLIAAFRATLEEVQEADCLCHVIDAASSVHDEQIIQVRQVLKDLGVADKPIIEVYNKIDMIADKSPRIDYDTEGQPKRVWLSAASALGLDVLKQAITHKLFGQTVERRLQLRADQSQLRAKLYQQAQVLDEQMDAEGNYQLSIKMPELEYLAFVKAGDIKRRIE